MKSYTLRQWEEEKLSYITEEEGKRMFKAGIVMAIALIISVII